MAIINLKGVPAHRYCPKARANKHRCYSQQSAQEACDSYNLGMFMPLFSTWRCGSCKFRCWHVGHDYKLAEAYEAAVINDLHRDSAASLHTFNLPGGIHVSIGRR